MLFILALQIMTCSLVVSEELSSENNPSRWWYRVIRAQNPFEPNESPCLLRGQPSVTRDDYTYTTGIGIHKVHTRADTWPAARRTCEDEGGHLAIINSVAEAKLLTGFWKNTGEISGLTGTGQMAFLGFHDLFEEGEFITVYGQSLAKAGYTQWHGQNPDNAGDNGENCGSLYKEGGLNDEPCHFKNAFICELPVY